MTINSLTPEDINELNYRYNLVKGAGETTAANANEYLIGLVQGVLDSWKKDSLNSQAERVVEKIVNPTDGSKKGELKAELDKFEAGVDKVVKTAKK